jgi:hypothetical protein
MLISKLSKWINNISLSSYEGRKKIRKISAYLNKGDNKVGYIISKLAIIKTNRLVKRLIARDRFLLRSFWRHTVHFRGH